MKKKKDEDIIGFVVRKIDSNTLIIKDLDNEEFEITIPSVFHYSIGDAVAEGHDFSRKCKICKNEQLFDTKEEEWYCPVNHDD